MRGNAPVADGGLPAYIAVMAKAANGLRRTLLRAAFLVEQGKLDDKQIEPESILALAEESNDLVGSREVCAAPSTMILAVLRAILDGNASGPAEGARLADDLDVESFLRFSALICDSAVLQMALTRAKSFSLSIIKRWLPELPLPPEQVQRAISVCNKAISRAGLEARNIWDSESSRSDQALAIKRFARWCSDPVESEPASVAIKSLARAWLRGSRSQQRELAALLGLPAPTARAAIEAIAGEVLTIHDIETLAVRTLTQIEGQLRGALGHAPFATKLEPGWRHLVTGLPVWPVLEAAFGITSERMKKTIRLSNGASILEFPS
jgi:hypothetical protein